MRIDLFTGNYNHIADGVSLTLNRLVAYLVKSGVEVRVFGPSVKHPPVNHEGDFVEVPSIPAIGRPEYRISIAMGSNAAAQLQDFNPDIIHIATPDVLGLLALRYAKKHQIPAVSTYHTHFSSYLKYYGYSFLEPALWKYLKWFYGSCEQLYVPSDSMKEVLEAEGIATEMKIWERGIKSDVFHPVKRSLNWRQKHGFQDDDIVVLYLSRIVKEKGIDTVVETMRKTNPAIKWCIVGDGPAREEMQRNMPKAVFTGKLFGEELTQAYGSADIFFFPSDTETFGNVTLEAMASGLPILVADATGSKSLVKHGENGFLTSPVNSSQFAEWIELLAGNAEKRQQMAVASRSLAEQYDWEVILAKMIKYYSAIKESMELNHNAEI